MPRQPTVTDIQLSSIITCLTPTIPLLNELHDGFGTPFVQAISNTTASLISALQNVKRNKDDCLRLMEDVHALLYAIVSLHIKSKHTGSLPPATLVHIGTFTETLYKIHTFLEAQQDGNRLKHFFRKNEINKLFNECHTGLRRALEVFQIEASAKILTDVFKMQEKTQSLHEELLDLISSMSDESNSDRSSSIYQLVTGSQNSSNSFAMLPAQPKIFHGREMELGKVVKNLNEESPRIAILGAGGMGKTSLAKAALHHPSITTKYGHRFFVACDPASSSIELAALIGSNLGLKLAKNLTKDVVQHFSKGPSCLLVLDNLETSWEPTESRADVEEFLSLLAGVPQLALIITMRGAERPAKVRWTHPLLTPLKPLSDEAARLTFVDIADYDHDNEDITQLLQLTDNMPLAVDLLAHLVDYEGCASVLSRWKTEKTSLLSEGYDKMSNLDSSILVSLSSPRMTAGATELLSLLSILPDGLSDVELVQTNLPITNILTCKAVLLQTSLAYSNKLRLKVLVPIREHIQQLYPPPPSLIQPLRKHFHLMLDLYRKHFGVQLNGIINQITSNLGNLNQILLLSLRPDNPDLVDTISCTIAFNSFRRRSGHDRVVFMDQIPDLFPLLCDPRLQTQFITEVFLTMNRQPVSDPELLVRQAVENLTNIHDPLVASKFYLAVGGYYHNQDNNIPLCMQFFEKALTQARISGDGTQQATVLNNIAYLDCDLSNYHAAHMHACEAQKMSQLSSNLFQEAIAVDTQAWCYVHQNLGNDKDRMLLSEKARQLSRLCGMDGGSVNWGIMITEAEAHLLRSEYVEARSIYTEIVQNTSNEKDPWHHALGLVRIAQIDVITGVAGHHVHLNLDKARKIMSGITFLAFCDITYLSSSWGKDAENLTYCLERVADVGRWSITDFDWSARWAVVYLGYAQKAQLKFELHKALQFLGDIFLCQEDPDTAHSLFSVALEGFTYTNVHRSRADCMLSFGDIAKQRGEIRPAIALWKEARPLFERSLKGKDVAQIDSRLDTVDVLMSQKVERDVISGDRECHP
ncbi:hypothetical protein DFH09DRAFT_1124130 [Mycena vulgaris]|nr:hypothetical protein DFH09DRAFT_1124130 [Mycena vulgaris]